MLLIGFKALNNMMSDGVLDRESKRERETECVGDRVGA